MITYKEIQTTTQKWYLPFLKAELNNLIFLSEKSISPKLTNKSDIAKIQQDIIQIINHSKEKQKFGYLIDFETINTQKNGKQTFPKKIYFPSKQDFLHFIGKQHEYEKVHEIAAKIKTEIPKLSDWVLENPKKIIENISIWDNIIKVCRYFIENPKPYLYIRELPIDIDTKFIENNKPIIKALLDILIENDINQSEIDFEKRFNLRYDEPRIRIRFLDESLYINSTVSDIEIPVSELCNYEIACKRVFVAENKMNVLTFPMQTESIIIFGGGKQVEILKNIKWLHNKELYYWGDIDTHGFQILSRFRNAFKNVVPFLMDKETLDKFYSAEYQPKPFTDKTPEFLTENEVMFFYYLKNNDFGLEQEKIPLNYVNKMINMNLT